MRKTGLFFFAFLFAFAFSSRAQEQNLGTYQVRVSLDKENWVYELNQPAKFTFGVTLNNSQVAGLRLKYSCGPEAMPPVIEKTVTTGAQSFSIDAGAMKEPGFFRCIATVEKDGRTYRGLATAGYRPDQIKPYVTDPADFDKYWADSKALLKDIPMDVRSEFLPTYSTPTVDVYHVSFQNIGTGFSRISRIYGILAVPKATSPGQKFPALLNVPGAGVRPYRGLMSMAERGIITLQIGIHGIPVTLDQPVYDDLRAGALNRYMHYNLDNKETYYYRRVFLGCFRAIDLLVGHPLYDGRNLGVIGGSQGGGLSMAVTALEPRVTTYVASYPALADLPAYIHGRAGGWHHAFKDEKMRTKERLETASYYDAVNFGRRIKVPGLYSWGFNDEVVPPTSMYAAYNTLTAPKTLLLGLEMGHTNSPEQTAQIEDWLEKGLKPRKVQ